MNYEEAKKKIPTKTVEIKEGEETLTIEIYQWVTQDEDDQLLEILAGDTKLNTGEGESFNISVDVKTMREHKLARFKAYTKGMKWEQFSVLSPANRDLITKEIDAVQANKEDKKK